MMFIWKSVKSFKQHVSDMKLFHQSHEEIPTNDCNIVGNMPQQGNTEVVGTRGGSRLIISTKRKSQLVPLWEIELPRGIRN